MALVVSALYSGGLSAKDGQLLVYLNSLPGKQRETKLMIYDCQKISLEPAKTRCPKFRRLMTPTQKRKKVNRMDWTKSLVLVCLWNNVKCAYVRRRGTEIGVFIPGLLCRPPPDQMSHYLKGIYLIITFAGYIVSRSV